MEMRVDMVTWTSLLVNVTTAIDEFLNTWTKLFTTFHSNTVVLNVNIFLFVDMKDKIKVKLCEFELQRNSFVNTLQILWNPRDTRGRHRQSNKDNAEYHS